jgi:hypothetical protein
VIAMNSCLTWDGFLIQFIHLDVQLDLVEQIRNYMSKTIDITSLSSSSIGN